MKKFAVCIIGILMSIIMVVGATGCNKNNDDDNKSNEDPKSYTLQYATGSSTYQLTVTQGQPYFMESIPTKTGYNFMGLFDAEVGGTQYITANGSSVSPYTDGKSLVLYPQWQAKEYTLMLDYQGAAITGERSLKVSYSSTLPELPKNLVVEHSEFSGWYTQVGCKGIQVSDEYGIIPDKAIVDEEIFDLSNKNGFIYLYAGFEMEKHTVTFCFEAGMDTEEVQVPYNTSISEVVPTTRVDGNAVLTWSKTQGGEVWNGKVTDDMVLYAKEYAPVIELDGNGGSTVNPVVARAGSTIALPTPTKDLAKFSHWEDMSGNKFTSTTMPTSSTSLKAVWQAKLVFDENGGSDVDDISVAAGDKITLPTPEKEGFIFAGWFTVEKEQYTSTTMPSVGIALKAGWYKAESQEKVIFTSKVGAASGTFAASDLRKTPSISYFCYTLDLKDLFESGVKTINIKAYYSSQSEYSGFINTQMYWYSEKEVSSAYQIWNYEERNSTSNFESYKRETSITLSAPNIYICLSANRPDGGMIGAWWKDFWVEIQYPDTTNLYL